VFCDPVIESREDDDLVTGGDDILDALGDRLVLCLVKRDPHLGKSCKELLVIRVGGISALIPV
jgi:hypothetical protein